MDAVKWALELVDKVSPAGKKVNGAFEKISKGAKKLGENGLKAATKGLETLGKKSFEVIPKVAKWAAVGLAGATTGLIVAGGKLVADAIGFRDSTLIATSALMKSNALAGNAYNRMLDFAKYFGQDPAEALSKFNAALADGFSARDAEKLLQAFGDLKLVTPNVNADSLIGAFGKIRQKGILELGDFQGAVSAAGLNLTLAYEAIGKKIGKNAKEVEMLIGSGRVNAQVGLVGLLDAINQRTNSSKVGEKLQDYANTTSGLMDKLKGLPQQFALRLTADDSPIKGTLSKLLEQLDPNGPNGKKIMAALDGAFSKIGNLLKEWATPEGIEKISKTIGQIIEAAPKIISALGKIGGVVITIVDAFSGLKDNSRFLWAEFKRGEPVMIAIAAFLAAPIAPLILAYGAFKNLAEYLPGALSKLWTGLKDFASKAITWGTNIVDGLWTGIKNAWAGLLSKFKGLLDLLPDAAKKALGIASPAKKMMPIGKFGAQGVQLGWENEIPKVADSVGAGITGTIASGLAATSNVSTSTSTSYARSSSSRQASVTFGDIIVQPGAGESDARSLQRVIRRETTRAFELAYLGGE